MFCGELTLTPGSPPEWAMPFELSRLFVPGLLTNINTHLYVRCYHAVTLDYSRHRQMGLLTIPYFALRQTGQTLLTVNSKRPGRRISHIIYGGLTGHALTRLFLGALENELPCLVLRISTYSYRAHRVELPTNSRRKRPAETFKGTLYSRGGWRLIIAVISERTA